MKLLVVFSGGTIRRELDFQTRVHVSASTSIPIGNVGYEKKNNENHKRRFQWTYLSFSLPFRI